MPPTFTEDIKPLFSQYDRIKMSFFCDLWNYDDVKTNANSIYLCLQVDPKQPNTGWSLLPNVHVMPLYTGPWPPAQIALFKAWIDGGCQPGKLPPPPPSPNPELPLFVALSQQLTGFDDLNQNLVLAQTYFDIIFGSGPSRTNSILTAWKTIVASSAQDLDAAVAKQIMGDATLAAIAQKIILLWYNASIYTNLQLTQQLQDQYAQGLVWRAILAHPMGYAVENTPFYWQYFPQDGLYTGAYAKPPGGNPPPVGGSRAR
jgi:hypothetical protein